MLGKIEGKDEKGMTEGWMPSPTQGHEFKQAPVVGDGQGGLVCCGSWGRRVGHD